MWRNFVGQSNFKIQQPSTPDSRQDSSSVAMTTMMNPALLESVKCPICFEIYPSKILQCSRGHSICRSCYERCKLIKAICPMCKTQFGNEPVRNLLAEEIIGELGLRKKIECPFKKAGCDRALDYDAIEEHAHNCKYNVVRFGPFIKICKQLCYEDCPFAVNKSNMVEWIEHLRESHKVKYRESPFRPTFFIEALGKADDHAKAAGSVSPRTPIIINFKEEGFAILILIGIRLKHLLIVPYILNYGAPIRIVSKCKVKFTFTRVTEDVVGSKRVETIVTPVDITKMSKFLANLYCAFPIDIIEKCMNGNEADVTYMINVD